VHFNEEMGAWEVFAYQPCLDMLKQPGLYSSQRQSPEEAERGLRQSILVLIRRAIISCAPSSRRPSLPRHQRSGRPHSPAYEQIAGRAAHA